MKYGYLNFLELSGHLGVPGSQDVIETDYGLDGPGSKHGVDEIFRQSRPALEPTQPPENCYWALPGHKLLLTTSHFYCRGHGRIELYFYRPSGPYMTYNGITLLLHIYVCKCIHI